MDKIRPDGRALDEVRPVTCEVGLLARPHGSALFTRGQTQILNVLALAPLSEAQTLDGLGVELHKRYIHHYNFPPYSVGETKPLRSPGRREIGHGALAERALLPVIPSEEEFPYRMQSAWFPKLWNPTVLPPWAASAQARFPLWTQAYLLKHRLPA